MDELETPGAAKYPLLDRVFSPRDLRNLSAEQLRQVAGMADAGGAAVASLAAR